MKAIWNGSIVAQSNDTVVVEGNHYFPEASLQLQYFKTSEHTSRCPWKGTAGYYSLDVDGKRNENAAWTYREPLAAAEEIRGRVAFWKGVEVRE
jgi:uncharacterized protein (DUF427 family)